MDRPNPFRVELRAELRRVVTQLERHLETQRSRGRTAATDALRGVIIEEGEAEGLIAELSSELAGSASTRLLSSSALPPGSLLHRAALAFDLTSLEVDALGLALAVELDGRFARLVAFLNDHAAATRPTVGLLLAMSDTLETSVEFCQRAAFRWGLLLLEGEGPLPSLKVRVSPQILPRLAAPHLPERFPEGVRLRQRQAGLLEELILGEEERQRLKRWVERARAGQGAPLLLVGACGGGRATRAQAVASAVGHALVEVSFRPEHPEQLRAAACEAFWQGAFLLIRIQDEGRPSNLSALFTALDGFPKPLLFAATPGLVEPLCAAAPAEPMLVAVQAPTIEQRDALWRLFLPRNAGFSLSDEERSELAARFDFLPNALSRAARRASASRDLGAGGVADFEAISEACRVIGAAGVGPIAQRMPQPFTRADLVLPAPLLAELDLAATWLRQRRRVFDDWGLGRRIVLGRGLCALFGGQPGTGKTMAAQVLARELGLELYRIDLSRVMSKYIGETEKNLSTLFDEARVSGAMLFFDEADALFGKRTEVKDAHDRYANLEVGYLLQRIEEHEGTTVLATNRMRDVDEAFVRRFHFILEFPMPSATERRRIWEGLLPHADACEANLDLDSLSRDYEVSGGEIRNSILSAAFMAASEESQVSQRHLKRGLLRELLKTGRVLDARQRRALGE